MTNVFKYINRISAQRNLILIQRYNATAISVKKGKNEDEYEKAETVRNIESLLKINIKTALKVVNGNRELISKPPSQLSGNLKILLKNRINISTVLRYPYLLGISHLEENICKLKQLPHELNVTIVLAGLPKHMIDNVLNDISGDRISQLSELFQVSVLLMNHF